MPASFGSGQLEESGGRLARGGRVPAKRELFPIGVERIACGFRCRQGIHPSNQINRLVEFNVDSAALRESEFYRFHAHWFSLFPNRSDRPRRYTSKIERIASEREFKEIARPVTIEVSQQPGIRHGLPDRTDEEWFEPPLEFADGWLRSWISKEYMTSGDAIDTQFKPVEASFQRIENIPV